MEDQAKYPTQAASFTEAELNHMHALDCEATQGPWINSGASCSIDDLIVCETNGCFIIAPDKDSLGADSHWDDAAFIAAARAFVPRAIAALRALSATPAAPVQDTPTQGWISVADRLPERGEYLVMLHDGSIINDELIRPKHHKAAGERAWRWSQHQSRVTHWMPLPTAPTTPQKGE